MPREKGPNIEINGTSWHLGQREPLAIRCWPGGMTLMDRELQGEPRTDGCHTNFLGASQALRNSWARTGWLLSGSCHISDLRAGVGEWVRASCLREPRTQCDSDVALVYPEAHSEACIRYPWSLHFPGLAWCPLLTAELSLKAWSPG